MSKSTSLNSVHMNIQSRVNKAVSFAIALAVVGSSTALAQNKDTLDRDALKRKDSVVLKSGSTLFGSVRSEDVDDEGRKFVLFETEEGSLLKLDVARMIHRGKVRKIDAIDQDYNQHISTLDDDPDAHWELLKWCREQPSGKVRFADQIKFHLERIMELDPNDDSAKRQLGYDYIRGQDRWVPEKRYHQSLGYEKRGTSWAPMKQRDVDRRHNQIDAIEGDRKAAFRVWTKEVRKPNANAAALRDELFSFCDAAAVPIIFSAAKKEKNPKIRSLYVEAFGRVPHQVAMNALCVFAIEEEVVATRERALALLGQEHFNSQSATAVFATYLASESNQYVRRAAFAIGELGDESATLPLVGALVTTHMVKPAGQAGRIQTGTGSDGNINGLSMGGDSKPVMRSFENQEVANALRRITGQNFGYDALAWKNWYIENHTHYDVSVRR